MDLSSSLHNSQPESPTNESSLLKTSSTHLRSALPLPSLEEMLQKLKISHPKIKCPSENEVTHLCVNHGCQHNALCCHTVDCEACFTPHLICENVKLHAVSHLLQKFTLTQNEFFQRLFQIQDQFIAAIHRKRKDLIEQYYWGSIEQQYRQIIDSLYFSRREDFQLRSQTADTFFQGLKREVYDKQFFETQLLASFRQEIEALQANLARLTQKTIQAFNRSSPATATTLTWQIYAKNTNNSHIFAYFLCFYLSVRTILHIFFTQISHRIPFIRRFCELFSYVAQNDRRHIGNVRKYVKMSELCEFCEFIMQSCHAQTTATSATTSTNAASTTGRTSKLAEDNTQFSINSRIIKSSDSQSLEFIRECLWKPAKLELLFRGSEHCFAAAKFHQLCDNVENTLTLIKTESGHVIGGFTPITWNKGSNAFAYETTNSSFLLSLDTKQKMKLVNTEKTIGCAAHLGPIFGQYDIKIVDRCNTAQSCSNFPASYNTSPASTRSQQTTTLFCGATGGNSFKISQYEVYRVIWQP